MDQTASQARQATDKDLAAPPLSLQAAASAGAEETVPVPEREYKWLRRILLFLGPFVVAVAGAYVYYTGGRYIETENAYIKANKVAVSTEVPGPVVEVVVHENDHVLQGDILFRIDDKPYQVALARVRARLQAVREDIEGLRASYHQKLEELKLARINAAFAGRELARQTALAKQKLISEFTLDGARHSVAVEEQRIAVIIQEIARIRAQLDGDPDLPVAEHARYLEVKAEENEAELDLEHTVVRAPFAGIASKTPQRGQYVKPGMAMMGIVADTGVWVEANFKETELTHIRAGQPVTVQVDTYPGHTWRAVVDSISPASGAEFSIIPAQNATGNWVKVVQRIPVRIVLDTSVGDLVLRAGMSVTVAIDTGRQRPLPGFLRSTWSRLSGPAPAKPSRPADGIND